MRWESLPASCSLAAASRQFGAGMDQVGNSFGLGQINAAVEKGAAREFARSGKARAVFQNGVQHQLGRAASRRDR